MRTADVKAWIEAKPGAEGRPFAPGKNAPPLVIIYKVMGKVFAILSVRGVEDVILKCDPMLVTALRAKYAGIGHRSHLDRRFWISVSLDADVPVGNQAPRFALVRSRVRQPHREAEDRTRAFSAAGNRCRPKLDAVCDEARKAAAKIGREAGQIRRGQLRIKPGRAPLTWAMNHLTHQGDFGRTRASEHPRPSWKP